MARKEKIPNRRVLRITFTDPIFVSSELSCSPYEPCMIIARFHEEAWLDKANYWASYRDIWRDQGKFIQLAENLRMLKIWNTAYDRIRNPDFKTQVAEFQKAHFKALDEATNNQNTAYLYEFAKANTRIKSGTIDWEFYLSSQISLGAIYLYEYRKRQQFRIKLPELRKLIIDWQGQHGKTNASQNNQWNRALKEPRVKRLLYPSS
jgi:hypothetical protein